MEKLVVQSPENRVLSPYQNFSMKDMEAFYTVKQFLQCEDCTQILTKCIAKCDEIKHYEDTYHAVEGRFYRNLGLLGVEEMDHYYQRDYTVESVVWVSTGLLMNKLDASLYLWRDLNPELVKLLSAKPIVKFDVISNWVKMVHYLSPLSVTANNVP